MRLDFFYFFLILNRLIHHPFSHVNPGYTHAQALSLVQTSAEVVLQFHAFRRNPPIKHFNSFSTAADDWLVLKVFTRRDGRDIVNQARISMDFHPFAVAGS